MSLCPEPDCAEKMRVEKTTTTRAVTVRIEACPAGHRWETESVVTSTRKLPATKRPWTKVAGNLQDGDAKLPATSNPVDESCRQPVEVAGNPGATFEKLPATREVASKVAGNLPKLPATGAGGVMGGPSPIRNPEVIPSLNDNKGGDPDPDARGRAIPPAAGAAPEAEPEAPRQRERDPKHPRDAHGLLFLYGIRWEHWERKKWIGGQWDVKTADHLVDEIRRRCPEGPEREDAFEEVIACIDVFLRLDTPAYAGHKFERFVKELPLLRTGTARRESTSPYCEPHRKDPRRKSAPFVSGCAWCKHHKAAGGQRAGDAVPVGELVATSEAAWTPEQRAEAEQLRAARQADTDRRGAEALRELQSRVGRDAEPKPPTERTAP